MSSNFYYMSSHRDDYIPSSEKLFCLDRFIGRTCGIILAQKYETLLVSAYEIDFRYIRLSDGHIAGLTGRKEVVIHGVTTFSEFSTDEHQLTYGILEELYPSFITGVFNAVIILADSTLESHWSPISKGG